MKKLFVLLLVVTATVMGFHSWRHSRGARGKDSPESVDKISYYTCPMHPQIHKDHPGSCPICGMTLVPVYQPGAAENQGVGNVGVPQFVISPERQQLIGVKTEIVVKKSVTKEIRTVGRVAFDPELSVAQQEFVEIAKNVPSLKAAARSRLKVLGMSEEEIKMLEKKGKVSSDLYLPGVGDSVWVYATLYQAEMEQVKQGMEATISLPEAEGQQLTGTVRGIDPIVDPMTRSVRARIEILNAGDRLRPNSFVNVAIKVDLGEALVIPKTALIDTGMRHVVFVVEEDRNFQSRDIHVGPEAGENVIVLDGVAAGERVVIGATFLVDSESRLKAAILSPSPKCPEGQKWDVGMAMCMPGE